MAWPTVRSARPRASHAQEKTAWAQATFDLLAVAASSPEGEKWRRPAREVAMCVGRGSDGNE
uniref:Uncharacterized protein n=1 Tax=Oryza glaberrima TaxID=4538 RepID=I1QSG5_ORYGL